MATAPFKIPVNGPLNTSDPVSSVPVGTLVEATDTGHRWFGPRPGYGRAVAGPTITTPISSMKRTICNLDGTDDYLAFPAHAEQMVLGLDFTIDCLFEFDGLSSGVNTLFSHGAGGAGFCAFTVGILGSGSAAGDQRKVRATVTTDDGAIQAAPLTLTGTTQLTQSATLANAIERMHHVRLTRSKGTVNLYVNGTLEATSALLSATQGINLYSGGLQVGRDAVTSANTYWNGYPYRCAIVSGVLTNFQNARTDWSHTLGQHVLFYSDGGAQPATFTPFFSANAADELSRFHNLGTLNGNPTVDSIGADSSNHLIPVSLPVQNESFFTDRQNRGFNVVVVRGKVYQQRCL